MFNAGEVLIKSIPRHPAMGPAQPQAPGTWTHGSASNVAWSTAPTTTSYTSASAVLSKT